MDVMKMLAEAEAVLQDKHFALKSSKHSTGYINADMIYPFPRLVNDLGHALIQPFKGMYDVVVGPAMGGTLLSYASAYNSPGGTPGIWADKAGNDFVIERAGFAEFLPGKRVLVVEDLLTTGGSVIKVCQQVILHGGILVGVSAIVNRGGVTAADLGVPLLESLASVDIETWEPADCPSCAARIPIVVDVGHGAVFMRDNPNYPGGFVDLRSF
jgi:orotate phosphoribosyltransferase